MKMLLLFACLASTPLATAQTYGTNPYNPPREPTILPTTFVPWDSLTPTTSATGQVRRVFDNPTAYFDKLDVHITTLNPGMESHPPRHDSWEEIALIKEGDFELNRNGVKQRVAPGTLLFFTAKDAHSLRNIGAQPGTYYVIIFVNDPAHPAASTPPADALASSIFDCNSLPPTATPTGSRVTCANAHTLTFPALESHISTLNPGQHTAADIVDPNDEIVIIKSGQVEVTVNGIATRLSAGSLLYWAPNDKRSLRNIGTVPTSYQVIRVTSPRTPKAPAN